MQVMRFDSGSLSTGTPPPDKPAGTLETNSGAYCCTRASNGDDNIPADTSICRRCIRQFCSCFLETHASPEPVQLQPFLPGSSNRFADYFQAISNCGANIVSILTQIDGFQKQNKKNEHWLTITNHENNNVIMALIECGNHLAAMLLIESLFDDTNCSQELSFSPLTQQNIHGDTALTLALKNHYCGWEETAASLLSINYLPQLTIPDGNQNTPLMLAINRGNMGIINEILEKALYGTQVFEGMNNNGYNA